MSAVELPLLTFPNAKAFETWLSREGKTSPGAWLCFAKQGAPETTLTKPAAIDSALAHGWIDGQLGSIDRHYFKIRFTPRRPKSVWSKLNRERIERLIEAGRMTPRGMAEVNQAKADGRWAAAYDPPSKAAADADLTSALDAKPKARAFYDKLDSANRYAVLYRIQQTKSPEKRAAKIAELVAMLARGEAIHPLRRQRATKNEKIR